MKKYFICYILFCLVPLLGLAQNKPKGNTILSVSTNSITIAYSGEETRFSVSCNVNYSVSSSNSWLHVYRSGDYIRVVCDANYSLSSRTGQVIVKTDNGVKTESVAVYQYGKPNNTLSLSTERVTDTGGGGTIKIIVSTNAPYWGIKNMPYWCSYKDKTANSFTLVVSQNTLTSNRKGSFSIYAGDVEKTIVVEQAQRRDYAGGNTNAQGLFLTKTSIICSSSGTTEYLTVSSNRAWEIQYPTGNMYSVTRNGNTLKVTIYANTGTGTRGDFFNVRLVDGSKVIKVHLQQSGRATTSQSSSSFYSSSSSRSNYSNNSSTHYTRTSAYQRYIHYSGSINVTWIGISAGIGSGMSILGSTLRCRFGPVEIRPIDIAAIDYNFINGDYNFSYQPIIDFYVPVSADKAIYFGAGPSVGLIETNLWFRAEGGLHWNWGGDHASSDFFFRYDGAYMVGLSIQCSSHW